MNSYHFKQHPYIQPSKFGFVLHGEQPKNDKFGDFEKFQTHFQLPQTGDVEKQNLSKEAKNLKLECQRYYWGKGRKQEQNESISNQDDNGDANCEVEPDESKSTSSSSTKSKLSKKLAHLSKAKAT